MLFSDDLHAPRAEPGLSRAATFAFILLFWLVQFSILTVQRVFVAGAFMSDLMLPRLLVTAIALLLSVIIAELLRRLPPERIVARLAIGFACILFGTALHATANFLIFSRIVLATWLAPMSASELAPPLLQWFWSYFALVGTLLAISHSLALRQQARRLAVLQRASHSAQLRSLRLQLNPHFMFNTLNSIAALIGKGSLRDAESMVENLSDFLRASLATAPEEQVTLAREIEFERHYLDIETIRFASRLTVSYDLDSEAGEALVPALITQPIVENVIRHAVTRSTEKVRLTISARRDGEWLRLGFANTAASAPAAALDEAVRAGRGGTGLGIRNVALRLCGHYGQRYEFAAGPTEEGGYDVRLALPFVTGPPPC